MGIKKSIRIKPEEVRELGFATIAAGYKAIGDQLEFPSHLLYIQNLTDASVWISFDGQTDHFPLVAGSFLLLDITSNKSNQIGFFIAEGTTFYAKQLGVPTSGSVYVTSFYGS